MRKLAAMVAALALAGLVAPTHRAAAATRVITVEFEAEITLWSRPMCITNRSAPLCNDPWEWAQPVNLWAPTSPNPACTSDGNPLCPTAPSFNVYWAIGDGTNGPEGGAPCTAVTEGGLKSCWIHGVGAMGFGTGAIPGPYCYSAFQGSGNLIVTIGSETYDLAGIPPGQFHSWPILRWTLTDDTGVFDQGAGEMTIVEPRSNCGLEPPGFEPMREADVTGSLAWVRPL